MNYKKSVSRMSLQKIKITYNQHISTLLIYLIYTILYIFYNAIDENKLFYLEESLYLKYYSNF